MIIGNYRCAGIFLTAYKHEYHFVFLIGEGSCAEYDLTVSLTYTTGGVSYHYHCQEGISILQGAIAFLDYVKSVSYIELPSSIKKGILEIVEFDIPKIISEVQSDEARGIGVGRFVCGEGFKNKGG